MSKIESWNRMPSWVVLPSMLAVFLAPVPCLSGKWIPDGVLKWSPRTRGVGGCVVPTGIRPAARWNHASVHTGEC